MQPDPIMKQDKGWIWFVGAAVVIVAAALVYWFVLRPQAIEPIVPEPETIETAAAEEAAPEQIVVEGEDEDSAEAVWTERIRELRGVPKKISANGAREIEQELMDLLAPLDRKPAIAAAGGESGAFALFADTAVALAERPPIATGELNKIRSVLQNVSHLARVLGKKKTLGLAKAMNQRDADIELIAASSYRWLVTREARGSGAERRITLPVLYDYATFSLESLGGQAYLRRRLPKQEALASFYAILVLDRAKQAGHSPHGTDARPHIKRCRKLLETQPLKYRDAYLEVLDEVEARW